MADEDKIAPDDLLAFVPTLDYFQKTYGNSYTGNDQRALQVFRDFESLEKVRRLQAELIMIKNGKIKESALHQVVGKKRLSKFKSYTKWAELMLLWLAGTKK